MSFGKSSGTITSTFDDVGQLRTTTDGRGDVLARNYDDLRRLADLRDGSTTGPIRASYVYDTVAKGWLTSSTRHVGTDTYTIAVTGYTDLYQPTGTTITMPTSEGALAGAYTTGTTYRPDGSPATVDLPVVGGLPAETLTYSYNSAGLPTTLTGAEIYVGATEYAWNSSVTRRLLGSAGVTDQVLVGGSA